MLFVGVLFLVFRLLFFQRRVFLGRYLVEACFSLQGVWTPMTDLCAETCL
jgi:hypothetical protein